MVTVIHNTVLHIWKLLRGIPWWLSGLRTCHCRCCGSGYICGVGFIPGLGIATWCGPPKTTKKVKLLREILSVFITRKKFITVYGDECSDHFTIYTNKKSVCCTAKTTVLCVKSYFNKKLQLECFFLSFVFLGVTSVAYGASRARGLIGDVAAGLCQNPSNAKSETRLWPTPQLTATLDP